MDPALYPDPEVCTPLLEMTMLSKLYGFALLSADNVANQKFDPYRFVRLRTTAAPDPIAYKNREQYQFVSVTKENMTFGFGRHACPGRFFAANEIKLILAQLLLNYDIKLTESDAGAQVLRPDPNRTILMRKVQTA